MKMFWLAAFVLIANFALGLSTTDIDGILQKDSVSVEEGVWFVSAIKNPDIELKNVFTDPKMQQFSVVAKDALSYGKLAKIIIEEFNLPSAFLYKVTGLDRYAFLSLADVKLLPQKYSEYKMVNGMELMAVVHRIKALLYPITDDEEEGGK
ncbi:MAG: hypothetical protein HPY53_01845 [Brevinematales bacterium]|nr:hypothetical protein [Brevinematales bacterium]